LTIRPSKSARKREHLELQALGVRLIELPEEELRSLPLGDDLLEAILHAKSMSAHGALRRQRQLIGKLMARRDAGPIRDAFESLGRADRQHKATFRAAEYWRDRIVTEGKSALEDLDLPSGDGLANLRLLFEEFAGCRDDAARRRVSRRIFRCLHEAMASRVQDSALGR